MKKIWVAVCMIVWSLGPAQSQTKSLAKLSDDFWTWRAKYAPLTGDDVNRIERPGGTRDWSRATIDKQRKDLAAFEARWKKIDTSHWPVPQQVDYHLIGSGIIAHSLGARPESALETRSEFLHRADTHRPRGSAHC